MTRAGITLFLLSLLSSAASAADDVYKRFLIPIAVQNLPGAFGSRWTSDTWLRYSGTTTVTVTPIPFCLSFQCVDSLTIEPGLPPLKFERTYPSSLGVLLHVERTQAAQVEFASRIRDESRSAESAGTAVPIIPEDAMREGTVRLIDIPMTPSFRSTLRVYALPETAAAEVEVRYYRMPVFGGSTVDLNLVLLRTDRLQLIEPPENALRRGLRLPVLFPAMGEIGNLQSLGELAAANAVWVEIIPLTPGARIWAMASTTNNATQQVTLITP